MMMHKSEAQEALDKIFESDSRTAKLRNLIADIANYEPEAEEKLVDYLNFIHEQILEDEKRYPEAIERVGEAV